MTDYKPDGYPSVSPYLVVQDAEAVIRFLEAAVGAKRLRRYEMPDGSIMHAEVDVDGSVIMLGEAGGEWPPVPCHIHIYVPDVDAAYRRALEAGGTSISEPVRKEGDPDRRGGVLGPGGNSWWFSTQEEAEG